MPLPKILFPANHAVDYYEELSDLVEKMNKDVIDFVDRKVAPYLRRNDSYKKDSEMDDIIKGLEELKESAITWAFSDATAKKLADKFSRRVKNHTNNQVKEQIRSVIGMDPLKRNQKLEDAVKAAVSENVSLIKSIPEEYHKQLDTIVLQGVRSGESIDDIKDNIQNVYKKTDNKAKFIARDQAGSMLGDFTKLRHQELGLKEFIWRDSDDIRVRDKHKALDGKKFTWEEGANGLFPGKDYNCRCTAEIVAEELDELWGGQAA